jgi:hypothetical protein
MARRITAHPCELAQALDVHVRLLVHDHFWRAEESEGGQYERVYPGIDDLGSFASEAVTKNQPERADWQHLLAAWARAQDALPDLDLAHYDLPGALAQAEALKAGTAWRSRRCPASR